MTTWIAFFFAFLLVIFVHELGHYLLALYWRVSVHRFSIGFGRPLFTWKSIQPGLHSVTEFSINIIPLGGYVKFKSAQDNAERAVTNTAHPIAVLSIAQGTERCF